MKTRIKMYLASLRDPMMWRLGYRVVFRTGRPDAEDVYNIATPRGAYGLQAPGVYFDCSHRNRNTHIVCIPRSVGFRAYRAKVTATASAYNSQAEAMGRSRTVVSVKRGLLPIWMAQRFTDQEVEREEVGAIHKKAGLFARASAALSRSKEERESRDAMTALRVDLRHGDPTDCARRALDLVNNRRLWPKPVDQDAEVRAIATDGEVYFLSPSALKQPYFGHLSADEADRIGSMQIREVKPCSILRANGLPRRRLNVLEADSTRIVREII